MKKLNSLFILLKKFFFRPGVDTFRRLGQTKYPQAILQMDETQDKVSMHQFIKAHWKTIVFIIFLIIISLENTSLGITYFSLEILFFLSLCLALFYREEEEWKKSLIFYLINRIIGLLQPIISLVVAGLILQLSIANHWEAYLVLVVDMFITIISLDFFIDHFAPIKIRTMNVDDIDALYDIELETFTENQRASKSQILKRINTNPGTCLVAEHRKFGVVGSLYVTPVSKDDTIKYKKSHKEIQNNDNFSKTENHDSLYIVGIQAKKITGISVALYLGAGCIKVAMKDGYKGILGGPRIPEYHFHKDMPLDTFIHSEHAKLLQHFIKIGTIPFIRKPQIICGLENYFPDPESLDCAALGWMATPLIGFPAKIRKYLSGIMYSLAITL